MRSPRHRRLYLSELLYIMSKSNTSTHPSNVQRRSTEPKTSGNAEYHSSFKDRWSRTGLGSRRGHSQKAHKPSMWRRIVGSTHGNRELSDPVQGCSRKSTTISKNSLSFEQTRPWDQKAILSLGKPSSHDLVVS